MGMNGMLLGYWTACGLTNFLKRCTVTKNKSICQKMDLKCFEQNKLDANIKVYTRWICMEILINTRIFKLHNWCTFSGRLSLYDLYRIMHIFVTDVILSHNLFHFILQFFYRLKFSASLFVPKVKNKWGLIILKYTLMWVITNKSRLFYVTWTQIKEGGNGVRCCWEALEWLTNQYHTPFSNQQYAYKGIL